MVFMSPVTPGIGLSVCMCGFKSLCVWSLSFQLHQVSVYLSCVCGLKSLCVVFKSPVIPGIGPSVSVCVCGLKILCITFKSLVTPGISLSVLCVWS